MRVKPLDGGKRFDCRLRLGEIALRKRDEAVAAAEGPLNMFAAPPVGSTWLGPATKSPADSGVHGPANTAPALLTPFITFVASFVIISKCSGAKRLTTSSPSATFFATTMRIPSRSMTRLISAFLESVSVWRSTSARIFSANFSEVQTQSDFSHPEPCSACERRSAAIQRTSTEPSVRTAISLGPATWSIATYPYTWRFAAVTNASAPSCRSSYRTPSCRWPVCRRRGKSQLRPRA